MSLFFFVDRLKRMQYLRYMDFDKKINIELSLGNISLLRNTLTEWRTVAPAHVSADPKRLERWLEDRSLFDDERIKLLNLVTTILADNFEGM